MQISASYKPQRSFFQGLSTRTSRIADINRHIRTTYQSEIKKIAKEDIKAVVATTKKVDKEIKKFVTELMEDDPEEDVLIKDTEE